MTSTSKPILTTSTPVDSPSNNMICSSCENLTIDRLYTRAREPVNRTTWNRNGYLELHPTYQHLQKAARNGCTNCLSFHEKFISLAGGFESLTKRLAILAGSQDAPVPVIAYLDFGVSISNKERRVAYLNLQVGTEIASPGLNPLILTFKIIGPRVLPKEDADLQYDFKYIEIEKDLWHEQNFDIARDWIQDCATNHNKATCPPINSTDLPTRLIDVHPEDHPEEPRLVQPMQGEKGHYIALSHCWGPSVSGERLLTTKATLESRLESIPLSKMPSNFLDATIITRKLGYGYLWIDSLCIIQDSREDWETESANMGNIYTNASLTLAAAVAKDSDGGMLGLDHRGEDAKAMLQISHGSLQDRVKMNDQQQMAGSGIVPDSEKLLQCHFKIHDHDGSSIVILEPAVEFPVVEEGWTQCAVDGPLAQRGWCLQERLLSYRILYYGERQIYWQCASSRKAADGGEIPEGRSDSSQSVSNDLSEWPDLLGLKRLQCLPTNRRTGLAQSTDWAEIEKMAYRIWRNVIYLSTNRELTKQTDKLPALAGMAQIIHSHTGDTFLAGFWRKDLLISLTWASSAFMIKEIDYSIIMPRMDKPQWEQKEPWLAGPSWSWTSVNSARLQFPGDPKGAYSTRVWPEYEAQIMEATVTRTGKLEFGEVQSGQLCLRGYTYPRYDSRTYSWNPAGSISWVILKLCPQSPRKRDKHKLYYDKVYWDYVPRQRYTSVVRLLLHIVFWLFNFLTMRLWWGGSPDDKDFKANTLGCPACMDYLCINLLSIAGEKQSDSNGHEIVTWALILEQVPGRRDVYRRIGLSNKRVLVSEREFSTMVHLKPSGSGLPEPFASCELRTVEVI